MEKQSNRPARIHEVSSRSQEEETTFAQEEEGGILTCSRLTRVERKVKRESIIVETETDWTRA